MRTTRISSPIRWISAAILAVALASGCGSCDPDSPGKNNEENSQQNGDTNNDNLDAGNNGNGDAANNGNADGGNLDGANNGLDGGNNATDMMSTDVQPREDAKSPFELTDGGMVDCGDGPCACDDGMDNDGDGLTDGFDPECTGPYDDDEGTFATGIPGDNQDPVWQDCFFDGNSGSGDDKCRYKTGCLTGELDPTHKDCEVSQQCLEFCQPLTPNGCDCFGCCTVFDDEGTEHNVIIGGECSTDVLGTDACTTCEPSDICSNDCGECELCLGKELEDLPDSCFDDTGDTGTADGGGTGVTCEDGQTPCESSLDCPSDGYCQLGCCINIVL